MIEAARRRRRGVDRLDRSGRPEWSGRPDRSDRSVQPVRSDRPGQFDRSGQLDRSDGSGPDEGRSAAEPSARERTEGAVGAGAGGGAGGGDASGDAAREDTDPQGTATPDAGESKSPPVTATPEADGGPEPATTSEPVTPQEPATTSEPATTPERLQLRALQALCRQVFGFRLAMIALAAPAALVNASPGLGARLVGAAVVVTFMGSYVLFRDWGRFGPLLLRHPALLAVDTLFGSLLLVSAGPETPLAYVSVCTPFLAGLVYSWRGAACFASLQSLILLLAHATSTRGDDPGPAAALFLPGLCVVAGAMGSTLRNLMLRYGAATQALTAVRARLAATEAVNAERSRLAREMHDSVAKTLHGVALAADGLAASAAAGDRRDPELIRSQAELVARSARRAAAETRELLTDLRTDRTDALEEVDLLPELRSRCTEFASRTRIRTECHRTGEVEQLPPLPPTTVRQLLAITTEALENAHRHAAPTRVTVGAGIHGDLLRVSVHDDGVGLPPGTTLENLRRSGHFGLVGMVERAGQLGARIRIGRGGHTQGTEVLLELPLRALPPKPPHHP